MKQATAALIVLGGLFLAAKHTLAATAPAPATQPAPAAADNPPSSPPTAQAGAKPADEMIAKMTTYYVAFLRRGAKWTPGGPGSEELMKGHMANIQRLSKEGKLVLAGPFLEQTGPGSLAGLFFLKAGSSAEARQLVDTDPAVQAGRFTAEIVPWLGPKILAKIPEMFEHTP